MHNIRSFVEKWQFNIENYVIEKKQRLIFLNKKRFIVKKKLLTMF